MAITRKNVDDLRARLESVIKVFDFAHKRAAEFQKTHPGSYAEILGEKNLHEPPAS